MAKKDMSKTKYSNNLLLINAAGNTKEWVDTSTVKGVTYYYHVILLGKDGKEVTRTAVKDATAINQAPQPDPDPTPPLDNNTCQISLKLRSKTTAATTYDWEMVWRWLQKI
jgi:hypothetical protein